MGDYNMLNNVPFNVNVPEFQPERSSPIFPQITRKYPCIEDVVTHGDDPARFGTLTWKIQQPDRSMVWTSVKLVLPLKMKAYRQNVAGGANMPDPLAELDMGVASRLPSCNIAVAESPMSAFRQSSMTINGRIFSEVNNFRKILDTCYRGTGPSSYGDNHSLKPIVSRDLKGVTHEQLIVYRNTGSAAAPVHTVQTVGGRDLYVQIDDVQLKTIDSAFSLLEHNGPFLERARKFQDELSADGKTWQGLITNYLELGPFQARARKGNTAVPYIRDFHLRLNYDTNPSAFDSKVPTNVADVIPIASCRVVPSKLFEFGTVANLLHHGESVVRLNKFITAMKLQYTEKPYLEITYTRFIEPQKPFYNLRCFEHQYEQSNPFTLAPPQDRISPTSVQRVTSRLLSYPTKIYVYADFADYEQFPWVLGGVRRSCMLKNLHCRVNQRPDIVFNPSQEECYEMFRRHTNSSLEFGAWLKSPIYCFDPVDLGQPDMFANDARLTLMEWDAEVSLTPLQIQENNAVKHLEYLSAMGYKENPTISTLMGAGANTYEMEWAGFNKRDLDTGDTGYFINMSHNLLANEHNTNRWLTADGNDILNKEYQFIDHLRLFSASLVTPTREVIRPKTVTSVAQFYRGMIWGAMNMTSGAILNDTLYYVPQSYYFVPPGGRASCTVPWASLTTNVVTHAGQDNTFTYNVAAPYRAGGFFQRDYMDVNKNGEPFNATATAPANDDAATPGAWAYITDRYGIRNQNTLGNATFANPGRLAAGSGGFPVINQKNVTHKWVCFGHTDAMADASGDDGLLFRWRSTNTAYADQSAGDGTDFQEGQDAIVVQGVMDRNVFLDEMPAAQVRMRLSTIPYLGPSLGLMTFESYASQHNFDYTLKTLYEYGNSQYQFSQDGAPTKVLPNLVPVGPSAGIPMLQ